MFDPLSPSQDFEHAPPGTAGDGVSVLSVSSLTRRIKDVLESAVPPCWVRGEVSNLRFQSSGHVYFSLKDATAQIACVLFRGDAARTGSRALLRDGVQVLAYGSLGVYEPRGAYQLIVRVVVDDGLGRLQQEFERLKQRLAAEGLFAPERKRRLPSVAHVVGFITSPTGAAVQDFIRILQRRAWKGRLVVIPVKVQGAGAAGEMVDAIELASSLRQAGEGGGERLLFDLLVLGRGGGSLEDLWAFNEEALVRAVAACPIPVVSAVGHEIDFTLCDFAADVRAETPSAAAELVSSGFLDFVERLRQAAGGLDTGTSRQLRGARDRVRLMRAQLKSLSPASRLENAALRLDDVQNRLDRAALARFVSRREFLAEFRTRLVAASPRLQISRTRDRVKHLGDRMDRESIRLIQRDQERLAALANRLRVLDPERVLARGFAIVRDRQRRPIVDSSAVGGAEVFVQFRDGELVMRRVKKRS